MHFTFVRKPQLSFDISLKGVMFSEVPGLVGEMKRRLLNVITAEAVEPARVYIDLSQPFRNLYTRKQGGRQGQLKVLRTFFSPKHFHLHASLHHSTLRRR